MSHTSTECPQCKNQINESPCPICGYSYNDLENYGMLIHKMCQECTHLTQGNCEGKTVDEVRLTRKTGETPCSKYEFDMSLLQDEPEDMPAKEQETCKTVEKNETVEPQQTTNETIKEKSLITEVINIGSKRINIYETKHQKFKRLSSKRLLVALDNIRKLSNLTNKAVYEWNETDKTYIVSTIRKAVDKLENKL